MSQYSCLRCVVKNTQSAGSRLMKNGHIDFRLIQIRKFAQPPRKENFLSQLINSIKQDFSKNEEMKESLRKFRADAEKLEQSDALKKARQKYKALESETNRSSQILKQKLDELKEKLQETLTEAQKTELAKRASQLTEELAKSAKGAAETMSEKSHQLGQKAAIKSIAEGVKAVKEEINESTLAKARMYKPPEKLRKRVDDSIIDEKAIEPNVEATGLELHKDSRWYQSWLNFKETNPYVNKVFHWKMRFDESDNPVVRASRVVTDKISDIIGGMFQKTELSEVLTEICKMDPAFDKDRFLRECEIEIIPNILEALIQGELEILKDWCHEAPYNILSTPVKQAQQLGYKFDSKILDVSSVDLAMGKMMEQGPVLVISFQTQQIMALRNKAGEVVEGDPSKILRMNYVWVLCRDQTELNPKAAWKLMDLSANSAEQWL